MKNIIAVLAIAALMVGNFALAHEEVAVELPDAGITPESPFFFLDRLGEAMRDFFTANPEAKARLHLAFAAERVAEIKVILETKGVRARGLEVAQARLLANTERSAAIVEGEEGRGKDVKALKQELKNKFHSQKEALEQTFKDEKRALKAKEDELKTMIREARQAGDAALVETLLADLAEVKAERELLEIKEDEHEDALEAQEDRLKDELEDREDAEEAIREAEEEREEVIAEAKGEGVELPAGSFDKFDRLLAQAKELFAKENYRGAEQLAKQAEKSLDRVDDLIDELEEENELHEDNGDKSGRSEKELRKSDGERSDKNRGETKPAEKTARMVQITGRNFSFSQNEIRVALGEKVRIEFTSADGFHDWTVDEFEAKTGRVNTGGKTSVEFTADKAGTFEYYCSVGNHRALGMKGILVVE